MSEVNKTDKQKKIDEASNEFDSVIDATSLFLKKTFPHAYAFIDKIKEKSKKKREAKASKEAKI